MHERGRTTQSFWRILCACTDVGDAVQEPLFAAAWWRWWWLSSIVFGTELHSVYILYSVIAITSCFPSFNTYRMGCQGFRVMKQKCNLLLIRHMCCESWSSPSYTTNSTQNNLGFANDLLGYLSWWHNVWLSSWSFALSQTFPSFGAVYYFLSIW